jgi:hypothetical protein
MDKYQALVADLSAEFPGHHLEISLWPTGGELTARSCEECGGQESESVIWRYMNRVINGPSSLDEAVAYLKWKIADGALPAKANEKD